MFFKNKRSVGFVSDVIRCDEPTYLIWRWRPRGMASGEHKREFAIRWGSSLRVKEGEVAVFVYKQKDGTMQDYIVGPFDQKIKTANFPVLSGIIGSFVGGDTPFQAEIYFINLAQIIQTRFAVPYFEVFDTRYPDFGIPVAVRGSISFRIENYKAFIKLHRLDNFEIADFEKQIKDAVGRYVKSVVANAPGMYGVSVINIESRISEINSKVEEAISKRFVEDFGVVVSGVDIGAVDVDETSEGYRELMTITKDMTITETRAKMAADIENYRETLRIKREEGQYAAHKQTQSANLGAYRVEKQAEVGVAGAEALGKMGENGAGGIDLGGNAGFNPASMMAAMSLGGAIGQNISATVNNALNSENQYNQVVPPIPVLKYHVAKEGKDIGAYTIDEIRKMIERGDISRDTLVWKNGIPKWIKACEAEEIKEMLPPEIE